MKVLSLFDGMACGMLAFLRAGLPVSEYHAYEIDKYAVKTSIHNFPSIVHHGDVFGADFTQYEGFDFLIGGSPCTYWSIAQSPDERETTASGIGWELFSQYVRALREAKPKFFIYENNKSMARAIYESISETFGFEPIMINSALVSAQNRQRYYWVGKRNEDSSYSKVDVHQPKDRGILLRDVLDSTGDRNKSRSVISSIGRTTPREYFVKSQGQVAFEEVKELTEREIDYMVRDHQERRWNFCQKPGEDDKAHTVTANYYRGVPYNVCVEPVCMRYERTETAKALRKDYEEGKIHRGMGAKTGLYAVPVEIDENGEPLKAVSFTDGKTYKVYKVDQGLITIKDKTYPIKLLDGYYIIRKLTVSECKRLQTVPEWYEFPVSNSQAYKMLGNGWTVEVIAHILEEIKAIFTASDEEDK